MATNILELRGSERSDQPSIDDHIDVIDVLGIDALGEEEDLFVFTRRLDDDTFNLALVAPQEYSALGFWVSDLGNLLAPRIAPTSEVAMFHFGFNTPTSGANARPTTGTATYRGYATQPRRAIPRLKQSISVVLRVVGAALSSRPV